VIAGKRVLALVPARRGSKGLPLKNIRPLQGKPLLAWPIAAARASRYVDRVVISTDDAEFASIAVAAGADAPFLRPAELANDTAPSIGFILHAIDTLAASGDHYDYLALLEPTSPLTEASDIDAALETLAARKEEADSIVGVTALTSAHPAFAVRLDQGGLMHPFAAPNFGQLPRRQDIEPLYCLDGSLYISTTAALQRERSFYHQRTLPYVTPRYKSFEVDDLVDFICIEALLAQLETVKNAEA
jgi:N-acylneuraminate cytidylyltransferase/CMP-N,N'-diacetyllegionaminic acid synthase